MLCTRNSCLILMVLEFSRQTFEIHSSTKFHENPSSGASCCSVRTDGQANMTKLIVAFRNFANALKNATKIVKVIFTVSG